MLRTLRRPKKTGLGDVLFGRNRGRILELLFGNPNQSYYLRQIAAAIGTQPGTVAPELGLLTDLGLLVSHRIGKRLFYHANQQSAIFPELKTLLAKTVGVFQLLRSALEPLADRIQLAFVYGSLARREETAQSDVDLMVVGQVELEEVLARLQKVEQQIQRPINPTLYSSKEFRAKLASGNHFVKSVVRGPKVVIVGDEHEFGRLGG
jgi:predicted nucleotidyltransferase